MLIILSRRLEERRTEQPGNADWNTEMREAQMKRAHLSIRTAVVELFSEPLSVSGTPDSFLTGSREKGTSFSRNSWFEESEHRLSLRH